MLDTFNEYHCLFLECSALISYKTITMGHTVEPIRIMISLCILLNLSY